MYMKDKNTRITLRLNEKQFNFVRNCADSLGVSPSEYLRITINVAIASKERADNGLREPVINQSALSSLANDVKNDMTLAVSH